MLSGGHRWSETNESVEISVDIPTDTGKKDIQVVFKQTRVSLKIKSSGEVVLDLNLAGKVSVDDCTWTTSSAAGKQVVEISLEKSSPGLWKRLES